MNLRHISVVEETVVGTSSVRADTPLSFVKKCSRCIQMSSDAASGTRGTYVPKIRVMSQTKLINTFWNRHATSRDR
eukprot:2579117-Amphidinium_carterae.1